jgi:hypothetical protein
MSSALPVILVIGLRRCHDGRQAMTAGLDDFGPENLEQFTDRHETRAERQP